jgi:hypothetical protein
VSNPTLKIKVLPRFPSSVTVIAPLTLDTTGGNYTFSIDETSFVTGTISDTNVTASIVSGQLTIGWSGQLAVSRGGTGQATLTSHAVLVGAGTSGVGSIAGNVGNNGLPLVSQGAAADPAFGTISFGAVTGTLGATQFPALTGDITSVAGALATTLATVNANVGSFGSSTQAAQITVNGKGLVTAAAGVTITPVVSNITGVATGWATFAATATSANLASLLTDEVSASGVSAKALFGTAGNLPATATNDSATAGNVGEYISSAVAVGSAVSLTTGTAANMTSISLTAGDWDVSTNMYFNLAATTTVTLLAASISQTTGTMDATTMGAENLLRSASFTPAASMNILVGPLRISLSGTTTIFAVAQSNFGTSTNGVYGLLRARRVR